ncbi:MAG: endonuclease/exonuclease/phosphatase family protein [Chitinophagales bacterium]
MRTFFLLLLVTASYVLPAQDTLQVMTYNIRNCHAQDGPNKWDKRKQKVFTLIKNHNPDVLGMQEVLLHQLKGLRAALKEYDYVGVGRNDGKTKGEYSPVFYRTEKFTLVRSGTFWLSETPNVPGSKSWDAALTRICTWAVLVTKTKGDTVVVLNTHFDHRGVTARENSMSIIARQLKALAPKAYYIISGDFNCTPDSKAYAILKQQLPDAQDTYVTAQNRKTTEINTDYGFNVSNKKGSKIDYIFCDPNATVSSCEIVADNDGKFYPSDHLPFFTTIILFSAYK